MTQLSCHWDKLFGPRFASVVCLGAGVEVGDPAELPLGQAVWPQICKCVFKENWGFFHVPIFQHSLE